MISTLKKIVAMKAALWVNTFLYFFKRLWIVGKWLPDSLYSDYSLKKILAVIVMVFKQLWDFCGKALYLLCFIGFPILLILGSRPQLHGQAFPLMVSILFFLTGLVGSFGDNHIFSVTRDKITLLKYMHLKVRDYTLASLLFRYVPFFLYYLPCLVAASVLCGASAWQGILVWLMLLCLRMMGEAMQLFLFDRTGKVFNRSLWYTWSIIGLGLAAAYLPPALGCVWPAADILLHPACIAALLILGAMGAYYIAVGYRGYEKKLLHSIDLDFLLSSMLKSSSGASFKEVAIKETDEALPASAKAQFQHLSGYAYLNALFFARHRRQLVRPVYYRLMLVAALLVAALVLCAVDRGAAVKLSGNLTLLLPSFVFVMYAATVADKACRAMFYNCDKDLLHDAHYRRPQSILLNFKIRLFRISLYNAAVAGALCLAAVVFCAACGTPIFTWDMLLFCTAILLLSLLFTAHHLSLYYIFQPYSDSLKIKNPFFSALHFFMYFLCFLCLKIQVGGFAFTMLVLGFTVIYIAAALALVFRLAPKSFRAK